jgi:signal transduction histidine kinase
LADRGTRIPPGGVATFFAPSTRRKEEDLRRIAREVVDDPVLTSVMETVGGYVLVLSPERQIVAASPGVLYALNVEDSFCLVGMRPGEAFHCVHYTEAPGGCGTGAACRRCGAVLTILTAQAAGEPVNGECRLVSSQDGRHVVRDYRVRALPVIARDHEVLLVVMHDISRYREREAYERVFLHDLVNVVSGIMGWSDVLSLSQPDGPAQRLLSLSHRLSEQVEQYRTVTQAEEGTLSVTTRAVEVGEVLADLQACFGAHQAARGRILEVVAPETGLRFESDPAVVGRVLANMVRNALEAVDAGGTVRVWCEEFEGGPAFHVHNDTVMPDAVAERVFQRGFSTKAGSGHGLGTYGMKLLGERCLGGRVWFHTGRGAGTTFSLALPARGPGEPVEAPDQPLGGPERSLAGGLSSDLQARLREGAVAAHVDLLSELLQHAEQQDQQSGRMLREIVDEYLHDRLAGLLSGEDGLGDD